MIPIVNLSNENIKELSKDELIEVVNQLSNQIKLQEDFLLNISHDLRNPINVILSILQCYKYIDTNNNERFTSKNKEYGKLIRRNTLKMVKLIDNLIDTTKLEGNYYKINKKNLDIVNIVEGIVFSVDKYAKQKDIELVFDTNVEECITAVDPECLDRIIMNLLSNAIKFSDIGGHVLVYIYVDKNNIKITVKDQGRGISAEDQELVFNRFVQANQANNIESKGSGIGLELVKYLTGLHGGDISLKSELGVGSEFILTLPISNVEACVEDHKFVNTNKIDKLEIEFSDIYL
jgi:signal transduction histidine kinase